MAYVVGIIPKRSLFTYIVNTMAADDLAMQSARSSAAMVLA